VNKHIIPTVAVAGTMLFIVFAGVTVLSDRVSFGEENTPVVTVQAESVKADDDNGTAENNGTAQEEKKAEESVSAADTGKEAKDKDAKDRNEDKEINNDKKDANKVEAAKVTVIDGLVLSDAERRVFDLTNAERRKRGLPVLRLERRLMESARRQANWMARTGIFQHGHSGFAENIAMGQRSGLDVVIAWMNSSGHRRNMLNSGYGAIGIGSYRGQNGALYWCQQFSR